MGAFTWRIDNRYGSTRIGVFAEGGWGDYDTRNGFAARSIKGDSDIDYAGGGIFARHDFTNGIYTEGSFRIGNVRGDFSSSDIGNGAAFDSKMTYWGSHIGFGYIHAFSEVDSLDTYAKLYWTRQGSDSVTTDAKERLRLDSADSLTTHLGARYTHEFNNDLGFHFGLAWEHEYEGEQTGSLDGLDIGSPDMGGDSGIAEIGLRWKPERTGWSFDLTAHGGLGVRDSIGGTINIAYEF